MGEQQTVAVLGAGGTMGFGMARNLAQAGFAVRAWNRTREKAEPLTDDGAEILDTPRAAAEGADIVVTMLMDAAGTQEVAFGDDGAFAGTDASPLWLQTGTLGLEGTAACIAEAEARGLPFVDAPVLGTKQPALDGKLVILASGAGDLQPRVQPVLDAVGQRTMWVGEAGAGTRLKLVANSWVLGIVEAAAESFALAGGLGLDPALLLEAVGGGPLDLPYLQMEGKAILENDFTPSFSLAGAAKDARLIADAGADRGLTLPLHRAIADQLAAGAAERGDLDMIATYLTSRPG